MMRQDRKSPPFIFCAWLFLCTICSATAQVQLYPYTLPAVSNTEVLSNPWTGGFDLPQWSMGDLNQDGIEELAVFDRAGDSWLIFSWENDAWVARPELALKMPACRSFALLRDYNGDGIADIFTHTTGGIRLYRGSNEGLYTSFSIESNLIEYNTGFGNSTAWELLIGGAGVTGSNYKIRVACHIPSGKTNKSIVCTITELRRGMQFYDKSGDSLYAFSGQTDSGSDAINRTWANSFVVSNGSDSTNYNYRNMYLSGNQHFYFANGANQAYLHLDGSWVNASDIAYKKDIEDITYGIDTVKQLKPRKYKHKGNNNNDIGFIAQELESVVPEVVSGDDGSKGVSYGNLTATLTKGLQELITKVETLEAKVTALEGS